MADVLITVWDSAGEVALGDPLQYTKATIGGSNSDALINNNANRPKQRMRARLFAEADCWVKWGASPATPDSTNAIPLSANNPEYFDIQEGHVVAASVRV